MSAYREYLKSDHWKNLKDSKAKKSKKRCAICGVSNRLDLHHVLYRNILDVTLGDLRWLCRECHNTAHECIKRGMINPSKKNKGNAQIIYRITRRIVAHKRGIKLEG